MAAISEFAKAKALLVKQAFNYLSLFKGMDFLEAHYGAEHLKWLIEERRLSLQSALSFIYNSKTFELLQNPATGLCTESSAYNYDLLDSELKNGKIVQMEI